MNTVVDPESQPAPLAIVLKRAWLMLGLAALFAGAIQLTLVHRRELRPSDASAAAASAVMGLLNGRGLTVAADEVTAASSRDPRVDLLTLYHPEAPRQPCHQPLPGLVMVMTAVGALSGHLRYLWVLYLQIAVHLVLALLLAAELMKRSRVQGLFTGAAWLLFPFIWRVNLMPSYDAWTSFVTLGLVISLLRYSRRRTTGSLFFGAALAGAGLWVRDYLFVLPIVVFGILAFFLRPPRHHLLVFVLVPALFMSSLAYLRRPATGTAAQITRGSGWHTFWCGVGQFANDIGVENDDAKVTSLATRLCSGKEFGFVYAEFDPDYNRVLGEAGREYIRRHPGALVRNGLYRCVWMLFPGTIPSGRIGFLKSGWPRAIAAVVSVLVTLLAAVGFSAEWRRNPAEALQLLAPWLALFPLVMYYLIGKVLNLIFFVFLAFVGRTCAILFETRKAAASTGVDPAPWSRERAVHD